MDTCVICLEPFNPAKEPSFCEYCFRPLGHAKCIARLISVLHTKCPRCNKGTIQKPRTRQNVTEQNWLDTLIALEMARNTREYLIMSIDIIEHLNHVKEVRHMESAHLIYAAFQNQIPEIMEITAGRHKRLYLRFLESLHNLGVKL